MAARLYSPRPGPRKPFRAFHPVFTHGAIRAGNTPGRRGNLPELARLPADAALQPVIAWFVAAFAPAPGTAITPRTASPVAAKLAATVRSLRMVSPFYFNCHAVG